MTRAPLAPLEAGWVIVDGLPVYHRTARRRRRRRRSCTSTASASPAPTSNRPRPCWRRGTAATCRTCRAWAAACGPTGPLDLPGLARALISYCDAVGVERATFVGNSLGCPLICEVAASFPDRIEGAVLVSPAGGPNNQPIGRALLQMARRRPPRAARAGPHRGARLPPLRAAPRPALFRAMMAFPTLERVRYLRVPTLVVAGARDPARPGRAGHVFAGLPQVGAVRVPGAHALNFSRPNGHRRAGRGPPHR